MNKYWITCLIIAVPLLTAFTKYEGDGELINHGVFDANWRHTLSLGNIELSTNGTYKYKSANLPAEEFVFGIEIQSGETVIEPLPINSTLELSVYNSEGKEVIHKAGNIQDWTWSITSGSKKTFVYGRGNNATYLQVVKGEEYIIEIKVSGADKSAKKYTAKLLGRAQGWK